MVTVLVALAVVALFGGLSILLGKAHLAEMRVEPGRRRARRLAGKLAARLGVTDAVEPVVAVEGTVDGRRVEIVVADRSVVIHVGRGPSARTLTADPGEPLDRLEARGREAIRATSG